MQSVNFLAVLWEKIKTWLLGFQKQSAKVLPFPVPPERQSAAPIRALAPYNWALKELGQASQNGPESNPRILFYHSFTTLKATNDETPWCSAFMCAAAESTGFPSTKSAAAKSWIGYGLPGDGSQGDIAILQREGGHHVAFINAPYKSGDSTIELLGGNQTGEVCIKKFKSENILGIRKFC